MNLEFLKGVLRDNGVVGAGGAGFPTYAKLSDKANVIILNCAECEPLLKLHRQLLERKAEQIIFTLDLIAKTIGAEKVYIAVKKSYKKTIEAIEPIVDSFENTEISRLPDVYPMGDEVVLTYEVTGRIVPAGAIPLSVGVTVINVETVYNVSRALAGKPVTHKYVTLTGEVETPVTLLAPIGMKIGDLMRFAGGVTTEDAAYLIGGPMMGRLGSNNDVVTKTTNAVLVLPREHYLIKKKESKIFIDMKRAMAACCQCSYCTSLCPRNLLGHPINPSELMRVASNGITNDAKPYFDALYCSSCGLCELYSCVQNLSPRNLLASCKDTLRANGIKPTEVKKEYKIEPERPLRQVPMSRLVARLGLGKYNHTAPMSNKAVEARKLTIPLSQHIGAPSVPCVKVGDKVKKNQLIANAAEGLGVAIHSPMNGAVAAIGKKAIVILKEG